jgi:hypothetical protein
VQRSRERTNADYVSSGHKDLGRMADNNHKASGTKEHENLPLFKKPGQRIRDKTGTSNSSGVPKQIYRRNSLDQISRQTESKTIHTGRIIKAYINSKLSEESPLGGNPNEYVPCQN